MDNKLEIKFKNQKQSFEILEDEIIVDLNTAKHKLEYTIPLEEIKSTQYVDKTKEDLSTIMLTISFFLNIAFVLYFISYYFKLSTVIIQSILFTASISFASVLKVFFDGHSEKHIDSSKIFYFIYTNKKCFTS